MTRLVSLLAVTALLSACAGTESGKASTVHAQQDVAPPLAAPATAVEPNYAAEPPLPSAPSAGAPSAAAAPSTAARGRAQEKSSRDEAYAESEARPGLGTSWGETRDSRVSSAPFERRDGDNPFTVTTINYNDENGVRAMTRGASLGAAPSDGVSMAGGALRVRLFDGDHRQLPTYDFGSRRFVVGHDGERYIISLENRTDRRFEAVTTVDGLDVIDGKAGSYTKRGYLLNPYQTIEIDGFRQNFEQVAAFRFGSVGESYAARTGDARNVGVLGIALFAERGSDPVWTGRELQRRRDADPFPGRFATPPDNRWE